MFMYFSLKASLLSTSSVMRDQQRCSYTLQATNIESSVTFLPAHLAAQAGQAVLKPSLGSISQLFLSLY